MAQGMQIGDDRAVAPAEYAYSSAAYCLAEAELWRRQRFGKMEKDQGVADPACGGRNWSVRQKEGQSCRAGK